MMANLRQSLLSTLVLLFVAVFLFAQTSAAAPLVEDEQALGDAFFRDARAPKPKFIRFGKRAAKFIRFGRSSYDYGDSDLVDYVPSEYLTNVKRAAKFIRFG
ncbi:FLP-5 protein [Aphelenchoides avenae]|nr:FLP-5 protein [Aphelenchus avenae]